MTRAEPPPHSSPLRSEEVRRQFPLLQRKVHGVPLIYLDNAATTQKPQAVLVAMQQFYENENANVHRAIHELGNLATAAFEQVRQEVASFLNARSAQEIVFTRGTTESINLVAQSWGNSFLRAGDRILLTELEHHANLVPWQLLAQRTGVEIIFAPVTGRTGELDLDCVEKLLRRGIKLFAFTHISNATGTINPVAELCRMARRHGAITLVDAAQSVGHLPVNVQEIDCDFLVFSGHKMCGPTGVGVLYGRAELLETMPPWQGGGEMISEVTFDQVTFRPPPMRFEAGTPNIAGVIGLGAAIRFLTEVGRERIADHDRLMTAWAVEQLSAVPGLQWLGPTSGRASIFTFTIEGVHAHDIATLADQHGIALRAGFLCTQPLLRKLGLGPVVRASSYLYNEPHEIEALVRVLHEARALFL